MSIQIFDRLLQNAERHKFYQKKNKKNNSGTRGGGSIQYWLISDHFSQILFH